QRPTPLGPSTSRKPSASRMPSASFGIHRPWPSDSGEKKISASGWTFSNSLRRLSANARSRPLNERKIRTRLPHTHSDKIHALVDRKRSGTSTPFLHGGKHPKVLAPIGLAFRQLHGRGRR